jgi:erythromycin esterase-like protein
MNFLFKEEAKKISKLWGQPESYDDILHFIGDAKYVLLGEATHGTHEFYKIRAEISKRLIERKGFQTIAVEADWPDSIRVNRYIRNTSNDSTAEQALSDFRRFPQWMWRNTDVVDLVNWLRNYNDNLPPDKRRIGFYGLDLYSLHASIEAVLDYLSKVDPPAAKRARYRYGCFDHLGEDPQDYGYVAGFNLTASCEQEVVQQLIELRKRAEEYAQMNGRLARDEYFFAEQNARVIKNAEQYYRSMFHRRSSSWNLRDTHMVETIEEISKYLLSRKVEPKVIIWAHNSHLGDARATEMSEREELNVGQLMRERYGSKCCSIGFSTYHGSVTAASLWGGPAERKTIRAAEPGSYETGFHELDQPGTILFFRNHKYDIKELKKRKLERAIGVIYLPTSERVSHYFYASVPEQFDAMIHVDHTRAVEPLEKNAEWIQGEFPDTYPTGL